MVKAACMWEIKAKTSNTGSFGLKMISRTFAKQAVESLCKLFPIDFSDILQLQNAVVSFLAQVNNSDTLLLLTPALGLPRKVYTFSLQKKV